MRASQPGHCSHIALTRFYSKVQATRGHAAERMDYVAELPVHDDLELVLQASEASAAPGTSAAAPPVRTKLRGEQPGATHKYAMEDSIENLDEAFEALRDKMAMSFPFELDRFQKEGVVLMEAGESVFVAAHTSAGALARCPNRGGWRGLAIAL